MALALPIRAPMTESGFTVIRRLSAALLLAAACAVSACDEPLKDVPGPGPNLPPAFSSIKKEVLATTDLARRRSCVTCHTNQGRSPASGLNLRTGPLTAHVAAPNRGRQGPELEGRNISRVRMPQSGPPVF